MLRGRLFAEIDEQSIEQTANESSDGSSTFLIDMLKKHQSRQLEYRKAVDNWRSLDLVFPNFSGGYTHPNHRGDLFRKLLKEAELPPIHFHDLRHSAASILLCMGVNIKVIQELLGHSDISITLRTYSHLLPSMKQEVVETWNDVFKEDDEGKDEMWQGM